MICQVLMNNTSSLVSWTNLHGFNTKLEFLFLEVLNTSQIYPIISNVRFVKGLSNLHNICPDSSCARKTPLKGPSRMCKRVRFVRSFRCSLSLLKWRKVGLPLALWQESKPNFKGLPKVSGVTTNHWVFLRCDWSPVSS